MDKSPEEMSVTVFTEAYSCDIKMYTGEDVAPHKDHCIEP